MSRIGKRDHRTGSELAAKQTSGRNTWKATMTKNADGTVTVSERIRMATKATWGEPNDSIHASWIAAVVATQHKAASWSQQGWATEIDDQTGH